MIKGISLVAPTQPSIVPHGKAFMLLADYIVLWRENDTLHKIIVPKGFCFEISVPRILWTIAGISIGSPRGLAAACPHDFGYRKGRPKYTLEYQNCYFTIIKGLWTQQKREFKRDFFDTLFALFLKYNGYSLFRVRIVYYILNQFGDSSWQTLQK